MGDLKYKQNWRWKSELTYVGPRRQSVIVYYAIENENVWKGITQFKEGKWIDSEHIPVEVEIEDRKHRKRKEKVGKYVRIIWDESPSGVYKEKLETHTFVEANIQPKWDELEQLIKDAEMKVEIK